MTRHGITIGIYQCWDCNAVRKVEGRELNDLAHAPHCHKCGAPMFQLADPPPSVNRHPALRCPHCRLSFESNRYLGLHLRLRPACLAPTAAQHGLVTLGSKQAVASTVWAEKGDGGDTSKRRTKGQRRYYWYMTGIDPRDGRWVRLTKLATPQAVRQWLRRHLPAQFQPPPQDGSAARRRNGHGSPDARSARVSRPRYAPGSQP